MYQISLVVSCSWLTNCFDTYACSKIAPLISLGNKVMWQKLKLCFYCSHLIILSTLPKEKKNKPGVRVQQQSMTQLEMPNTIKWIASTCAQIKHWKITVMSKKKHYHCVSSWLELINVFTCVCKTWVRRFESTVAYKCFPNIFGCDTYTGLSHSWVSGEERVDLTSL